MPIPSRTAVLVPLATLLALAAASHHPRLLDLPRPKAAATATVPAPEPSPLWTLTETPTRQVLILVAARLLSDSDPQTLAQFAVASRLCYDLVGLRLQQLKADAAVERVLDPDLTDYEFVVRLVDVVEAARPEAADGPVHEAVRRWLRAPAALVYVARRLCQATCPEWYAKVKSVVEFLAATACCRALPAYMFGEFLNYHLLALSDEALMAFVLKPLFDVDAVLAALPDQVRQAFIDLIGPDGRNQRAFVEPHLVLPTALLGIPDVRRIAVTVLNVIPYQFRKRPIFDFDDDDDAGMSVAACAPDDPLLILSDIWTELPDPVRIAEIVRHRRPYLVHGVVDDLVAVLAQLGVLFRPDADVWRRLGALDLRGLAPFMWEGDLDAAVPRLIASGRQDLLLELLRHRGPVRYLATLPAGTLVVFGLLALKFDLDAFLDAFLAVPRIRQRIQSLSAKDSAVERTYEHAKASVSCLLGEELADELDFYRDALLHALKRPPAPRIDYL